MKAKVKGARSQEEPMSEARKSQGPARAKANRSQGKPIKARLGAAPRSAPDEADAGGQSERNRGPGAAVDAKNC